MKKVLIALLLTTPFISMAQDAVTQIFEKYKGKDEFTTVYVTQKMFSLLADIDVDDPDDQAVLDIIADLTGIKILAYEDSTSSSKSRVLYTEIEKSLPLSTYEELLIVNDKDEDVKILIKESGDKIIELLILTGSKTEFALISLTGLIDLKQIAKLSETMDIDGMDKLELLNEQEQK